MSDKLNVMDAVDSVEWGAFVKSLTEADLALARGIRDIAQDIVKLTARAGEKYYELCVYIREQKAQDKLVRCVLDSMGFHKAKVSEIIRVASVPEEMWNEFAARTIGFNSVLRLVRGTNVGESVDEASEGGEGESSEAASTTEKDPLVSLRVAAKRVLSFAEKCNIRRKVFNSGNGYELVIRKQTKRELSTSESEVQE